MIRRTVRTKPGKFQPVPGDLKAGAFLKRTRHLFHRAEFDRYTSVAAGADKPMGMLFQHQLVIDLSVLIHGLLQQTMFRHLIQGAVNG